MDIIPGSNVDIVLDYDWLREKIDVRRATVYDLNDERILLSQTAPPTARYNIGKKVKLTDTFQLLHDNFGLEPSIAKNIAARLAGGDNLTVAPTVTPVAEKSVSRLPRYKLIYITFVCFTVIIISF